MPPVQNLQKKGIDEAVTRSLIEDIIGQFPQKTTTVMCGDWNTRVGELSPNIDDNTIPRKSVDKKTN